MGNFSLSDCNQVRQVDEETRLNNGFSIQVSSYQQEALNLCFFSASFGGEGKSLITLLRRKIGHYHQKKAPALVSKAAGVWVVSGF